MRKFERAGAVGFNGLGEFVQVRIGFPSMDEDFVSAL